MKKFSKETGVLTSHCWYFTLDQEDFLCRDFVEKFFLVTHWDRISFRVTSYPLKEAVKIKLTENDGKYNWAEAVGYRSKARGGIYERLDRWLNSIPSLKKLKNSQTAVIYVSIYIHGKTQQKCTKVKGKQ